MGICWAPWWQRSLTQLTVQAIHDGDWRAHPAGRRVGLVAMCLRRWSAGDACFSRNAAAQALAQELPIKSVVLKHKLAGGGGFDAADLAALRRYCRGDSDAGGCKAVRLCPALTLQANSVAAVMLLRWLPAGRVNRRSCRASKAFIVGSILLACSSWFFYHLARHPEQLFLLYGLVGLCVGVVGAVPYVMVRAFPAEVRFSGISSPTMSLTPFLAA